MISGSCQTCSFEFTGMAAYDRVITLSTCAYQFENARYVLHGKLMELKRGSNEAAEAASVHRENRFINPKTVEKTGWLGYGK